MKNKLYILFLLTIIATCTMAQKQTTSKKDLEQQIQAIGDKYAPDKRVEVFSITAIETDKDMLLTGETSSLTAYKEVLAATKKTNPNIKDNIRILPDKALGEYNWGVIYNSVADLRVKPAYSGEMVTQVLLGMPVRILEKSGSWRRIQTPDGYIGWMSGSVQKKTREELNQYLALPKIIITSHYGFSFSKPDKQSLPVSDIVAGDMFAIVNMHNDFYEVVYADGREAFVQKEDAQKLEDWLQGIKLTGESIVETAKQFMGVPYVWGGTSAKGLDCSGFTKTVYWLHGLILARDASQQIKNGTEIDRILNFEDAQMGDLVFFGEKATTENPKERVIHVGIYIGDKKFIHASDYIHINSFDPDSPLYDEFNTNRYLRTMRILGNEGTQLDWILQ